MTITGKVLRAGIVLVPSAVVVYALYTPLLFEVSTTIQLKTASAVWPWAEKLFIRRQSLRSETKWYALLTPRYL